MKILVVNPGSDVYGSDLQMLESVTAFLAQGAQVTVLLPEEGPLVELVRSRGADVMVSGFPVLRRTDLSFRGITLLARRLIRLVPQVRNVFRNVRPEVVYVNTVTVPWWTIFARLMSKRVMCHVHEAESNDGLLVRLALYLPLIFAHGVVVISLAAERAATRTVPPLKRRTILVPNGVPDRDHAPVPAPRSERYKVGIVARLSPRKGTMDALDAIGQLRQAGRDIELHLYGSVFAGYEWYEDLLRQRAERPDLADSVTFHGYTRPPWPAFDQCDLILAPSHVEPFGNSVVEAQYSQRPVVASSAEGHLESITDGETGIIVPIGDVEQLAKAIARVMDDFALAEGLGRSGRLAALERNSLTTYQRTLGEIALNLSGDHDTKRPA